jgi:hypothetical protein
VSTNSLSVIQNLVHQFGYSQIDFELDWAKQNIENFNYAYNRYLGYYTLTYFEAKVFVYLFAYARPSRLEFEAVRRSGFFYTQFGYLIEISKAETNLKSIGQSLALWNKLPIYMVDDTFAQIKLLNNILYLPVDAYEMLMYFYPSLWWLPNFECIE